MFLEQNLFLFTKVFFRNSTQYINRLSIAREIREIGFFWPFPLQILLISKRSSNRFLSETSSEIMVISGLKLTIFFCSYFKMHISIELPSEPSCIVKFLFVSYCLFLFLGLFKTNLSVYTTTQT